MDKTLFICITLWLFFLTIAQSQVCYISADDPIAAGYNKEKSSVVKILYMDPNNRSKYIPVGTGVLIMNTADLNIPYVLTANHVLNPGGNDLPRSESSLKFCLQYGNISDTIVGSSKVSSSRVSDFALLRLSRAPQQNSGAYYAGWVRTTNEIVPPIVILHHPFGGSLCISKGSSFPTSEPYKNADECWHLNLGLGATAPKSSGAPYFDRNGRIIAQHFGSPEEECSKSVYGGKFSKSWDYINDTLDKYDLESTTTNTTSITELLTLPSKLFISSVPELSVCPTSSPTYTINITNIPNKFEVVWTTYPVSSKFTLVPNGSSCTIQNNNYSGYVDLICTIRNVNRGIDIQSVRRKILITYIPDYYSIYAKLTTGGNTDWLKDNNCLLTYTFPGMYSGDIEILNSPGGPIINNITWTKINQTGCSFAGFAPSNNGKNVFLNFKPLGCMATLRMTASNDCGSFSYDYVFKAGSSLWCSVIPEMMYVAPISGTEIIIYPNPTSGEITIDYSSENTESGIKEIIITNNLGKNILKKKYNNQNSVTLNLSGQKAGIYFLEVFNGKEWTCHQISLNR